MTTIKETLSAYYSESDDGIQKLNQYVIKEDIGQGSFGVVKLAIDQRTNTEYAMKEFSKHRLWRRVKEQQLRGARGRSMPLLPRGRGRGRPLAGPPAMSIPMVAVGGRRPGGSIESDGGEEDDEESDPLQLVRKEVAIFKKVAHPHVVQLYEVLDDPEHDTLYMVFEMCRGGVVMEVSLHQTRPPLSVEDARRHFASLVLGIEYLHANDVVHRDIKPENLLLSSDGELKIADLGVSEMFIHGDDTMQRAAGSPAFMAPELVSVERHAYSGKAADIWSMGVTLYCMCFGRLPFVGESILDVYDAIREQSLQIPDSEDPERPVDPRLVDLLQRMLTKESTARITMAELREHPWLTDDGRCPLLPASENCQRIEVTEEDVRTAVRRISSVITVIQAAQHWRRKTAASRQSVSSIASSVQSDLANDDTRTPATNSSESELAALPGTARVATTLSGTLTSSPLVITDSEQTSPVLSETGDPGSNDDRLCQQLHQLAVSSTTTGSEGDQQKRSDAS